MYKLKITVESKRLAKKILALAKAEKDGRRNLERALKKSGGNRNEAAKILGVSKRTIFRKLKKYKVK